MRPERTHGRIQRTADAASDQTVTEVFQHKDAGGFAARHTDASQRTDHGHALLYDFFGKAGSHKDHEQECQHKDHCTDRCDIVDHFIQIFPDEQVIDFTVRVIVKKLLLERPALGIVQHIDHCLDIVGDAGHALRDFLRHEHRQAVAELENPLFLENAGDCDGELLIVIVCQRDFVPDFIAVFFAVMRTDRGFSAAQCDILRDQPELPRLVNVVEGPEHYIFADDIGIERFVARIFTLLRALHVKDICFRTVCKACIRQLFVR